jgi:hypothetical protein
VAGTTESGYYESQQGRQNNAMAACRRFRVSPCLWVFTAKLKGDTFNRPWLLGSLRPLRVPRVVLLDDVELRASHLIHQARCDVAGAGIRTCYLPPNASRRYVIAPVFRQVQYQGIPLRSYTTRGGPSGGRQRLRQVQARPHIKN